MVDLFLHDGGRELSQAVSRFKEILLETLAENLPPDGSDGASPYPWSASLIVVQYPWLFLSLKLIGNQKARLFHAYLSASILDNSSINAETNMSIIGSAK
jgi:hypothetical protein